MAEITLEGVTKTFEGGVAAVDDVTLSIGDGEFLALVGPSGCGKSTLLRTIAGLEDVSSGTISIGERDVTDLAPRHRDIAMVFQSYALYPHMTVRQNLGYGLKVRRAPKAEIQARVEEVAKLLGLDELLHRRPAQLSGGQRQRVAIGRALVRQPAAFLLDEPLSNLDAKLRVQMRREIARLHRQLGTTMIYVTHDQVEAMTLGDRIAVLNSGRLQQVDTPAALYGSPANSFVASFIGTPPMNLVPGRLVAGSPARFEAAGGISLALGDRGQTALAGAQERVVLLGVRPEDLARATDSADGAALATRVELVELLGGEGLVHLAAGSVELTARIPAPVPAAGDAFAVRIPPDRMHFFDATTTERISA